MTRLAEIAHFTDEPEATVSLYRSLLGAEPVAEWPGGAVFAAGETKLLVHERSPALVDCPPTEDHFALGVTDVDADCAVLRERGLALLVAPRDHPWGRVRVRARPGRTPGRAGAGVGSVDALDGPDEPGMSGLELDA